MGANKITDYLNSFFKERIIETFESEINPLLEVSLINGRYQLNAGSVNYSFGPLHDAFRKYFVKDPPSVDMNSEILILGLGAGSVVKILREERNINCKITGIEVDKAVIEAARKHFSLNKIEGLKVIINDAFAYLKSCDQKFDLIIVDLYIDDIVPPQFESFDFVQMLSIHLRDNGKVIFNKLQQINTDDTAIKVLKRYFETVFDKAQIVKVVVNKETPNCFITGIKMPIKKQ